MPHTIQTRAVELGATVVEISGRLHLGNSLTYAETAIKRLMADGRIVALDADIQTVCRNLSRNSSDEA